jgi:hypothetical protein
MRYYLTFLCLILSASATASSDSYDDYLINKVKYKTFFGQCPSKVAGSLTLTLIKEFEKKQSLKSIKEKIVKDNLYDKHFLSYYNVNYDPASKLLTFKYDCPKPLMKVQIYKENGDEFYTSILVDNGKLFDPTYEVLLRSSKRLKGKLPNLAMPVKLINKDKHHEVTGLIKKLDVKMAKNLSEIILNSNGELTMILSVNDRPSSVFMGKDYWSEKVEKLVKVIDFMKKKKTIPAVINLTNSKKIVVKFPHSI